MTHPNRLLGREKETATLTRLAARSVAGEGETAFVVGEAGVGKTALVEQMAAHAESLGMQVLCHAGQEVERQHPFAVMSACLAVDAAPTDPDRARVAEILRGEVRYGLPGAIGAADAATVEAMLGLVEELCARGPAALILDDLQWADPASLLVLRRLMASVHQLPLLIIGACRPVPRVREVDLLVHSIGVRNHTVVELTPLSPPDVSQMLAALSGGRPGPRLRRMAEGAAGNPLYLRELVDALARERAIDIRGGTAETTARCSPSLPNLIKHRLACLSDDALHALRVAAVVGDNCTLGEFGAVIGRPPHEVLGIITEAQAAGVLRDTGDRLAFRHDLIRHTLADAVTGPVRSMVHLKAAQVLAGAGTAPERVAEHLLYAAPQGEFLIAWLVESAPRLTTRSPALLLRLLDRALDIADPADPHYGDLRLHHVIAHLSCGHLAEADDEARHVLARTQDPGMECAMRWVIVQAALASDRPDVALIESRAARASARLPAIERNRFHAFSAVCLFAMGEVQQAGARAMAARRTAEDAGDPHALAYALQILAAKGFLEAPGAEALELARQAVRLPPHSIHPAQHLGLQLALANFYTELDRSQEAHHTLAAARTTTEHIGGLFSPWYHLSCALLAFNTGRWDDALADVEAGLDLAQPYAMSRPLRAIAALIALHRGQHDIAQTHLNATASTQDPGSIARFYEYLPLSASVRLDEAHNNTKDAYSQLATAFDQGIGHLPGQLILGFLAPDIVQLALAHGDTTTAHRVTTAAQRRADHSNAPNHLGDVYRCQGLVARDPHLLLEAARHYHTASRPLHEAHAYADAAELLAHIQRPAEARARLSQALEIYDSLGASRDSARALFRLRSITRSPRRAHDDARCGWDALTTTEHIVAGHVARGHSNPQIGTLMTISRRTVSTHVSNILKKLDMTSRVQLAAEVIRRHSPDDGQPTG
ncbi:AAA family ATPase [Streptomyces sp. NPDC048506]|uniref:ATP-binding protein n=1 Tax=Streptomyces sp. NPDC048506 TaxID=3155028 RepID=UPI00343364BA